MSDLLILTPQLPYPPHQGTSLRNYHIIKGLSARHQITLLSFMQDSSDDGSRDFGPLKDFCDRIITVPAPKTRTTKMRIRQMLSSRLPDMARRLNSRRFEISLKRILCEQAFDIVQVEGIEMAWTIQAIRQTKPDQRVIYDAHNAESLLQYRALKADLRNPSRWVAAFYSWVQQRRLRQFEVRIGEEADWITVVSHVDKEYLAKLLNREVPITVIPNSIDVAEYSDMSQIADCVDKSKAFDLVFVGKMDYRPNVDAVLWFAENVWPLVLRQRTRTTWAIVGQKPHSRLDHLRDFPGVTVTGWVENVHPYLVGAKVLIMPFRVGSGTRLKLIEAMAAGRAIVSTNLGVEGYPIVNGQGVVLANRPQDMASKVMHLLEDSELRYQLGEQGRMFAQKYDWRNIVPLFDDVYDALKH